MNSNSQPKYYLATSYFIGGLHHVAISKTSIGPKRRRCESTLCPAPQAWEPVGGDAGDKSGDRRDHGSGGCSLQPWQTGQVRGRHQAAAAPLRGDRRNQFNLRSTAQAVQGRGRRSSGPSTCRQQSARLGRISIASDNRIPAIRSVSNSRRILCPGAAIRCKNQWLVIHLPVNSHLHSPPHSVKFHRQLLDLPKLDPYHLRPWLQGQC